MAKTEKKNSTTGKGSVEDASQILKQSQKDNAGEGDTSEGNTIDQTGEKLGDGKAGEVLNAGGGDKPTPGEENTPTLGSPSSNTNEPNQPGSPEDDEEKEMVFPIPNADQIESSAQILASQPDLIQAMRLTIERAEAIVTERDQPERMNADDMKAANRARLVLTYGKDFVTARKGNNKGYYNRKSWNMMGTNHMGWVEVTETMPETEARPQ